MISMLDTKVYYGLVILGLPKIFSNIYGHFQISEISDS